MLCGALARRRLEGPGGGGGCKAAALLPSSELAPPEQGAVRRNSGASGLGLGEGESCLVGWWASLAAGRELGWEQSGGAGPQGWAV